MGNFLDLGLGQNEGQKFREDGYRVWWEDWSQVW